MAVEYLGKRKLYELLSREIAGLVSIGRVSKGCYRKYRGSEWLTVLSKHNDLIFEIYRNGYLSIDVKRYDEIHDRYDDIDRMVYVYRKDDDELILSYHRYKDNKYKVV